MVLNMEEKLTGQASDDLTKALGAVVLNFAYLESALSMNIWVLIDISDINVGKIVTAGKPFSALIDLFAALYRHRIVNILQSEGMSAEVQIKSLTNLVGKMTEANDQRNQIIHSAWAGNTEDPDIHSRFKFSAKRSKGLERVSKDISTEEVLKIAHTIAKVADEVLEFSAIFHSPIFWLPHWKNWMIKWKEWEESGDLDEWLEWMKKLPKSTQANKD
jgi:hypothetical protein